MSRPALFLDRDGVINVDRGYVSRPEDCEFIDGIFDLVKRANFLDMPVVVVTNQSGIARGYYSEEQFRSFMKWMEVEFESRDAYLTKVYFCPHHPSAGIGKLSRVCDCRKPAPGMFLAARDELDIDVANSIMVGDAVSDMRAAKAAGVESRWLLGKTQNSFASRFERESTPAYVEVDSLAKINVQTRRSKFEDR